MWRDTFQVSNGREKYVYILFISKYCTYISEYYFQNHYMLIGKYILVIFHSLFVIRNFRGTCSSIEMLKWYMARESLITPVLNLNPVSSPGGALVGLVPQTNLQAPQSETWNTINQWSFCQFLVCPATPHKCKAPRRNAKPLTENFPATVLPKPRRQRQTINKSVCCFDWFITWFTGLG